MAEPDREYIKVSLYHISYDLPIGTEVRLLDDSEGTFHRVQGYEWFQDTGNVLFEDGLKLSMKQLDLIVDGFCNNGF